MLVAAKKSGLPAIGFFFQTLGKLFLNFCLSLFFSSSLNGTENSTRGPHVPSTLRTGAEIEGWPCLSNFTSESPGIAISHLLPETQLVSPYSLDCVDRGQRNWRANTENGNTADNSGHTATIGANSHQSSPTGQSKGATHPITGDESVPNPK
ncbi:hypothetical protein STEG23_001309 [Scotinomys teguina]